MLPHSQSSLGLLSLHPKHDTQGIGLPGVAQAWCPALHDNHLILLQPIENRSARLRGGGSQTHVFKMLRMGPGYAPCFSTKVVCPSQDAEQCVSEAPKPRTFLKAGIQMARRDILKEQRKQIERLKRSFINCIVLSVFFKVLSVFTSPLTKRIHLWSTNLLTLL